MYSGYMSQWVSVQGGKCPGGTCPVFFLSCHLLGFYVVLYKDFYYDRNIAKYWKCVSCQDHLAAAN